MKKKQLLKSELQDLSKLMNIDEQIIHDLQHLLNTHNVKKILILDEFQKKVEKRKLKKSEILDKLAKKYRLSRASIEATVYTRNKKNHKCIECNVGITKYKFIRCDEMCSECYKLKSHE